MTRTARIIRFPIERRLTQRRVPRLLPTPFEAWVDHRMRCSLCYEGKTKCRIGLRLETRWLQATQASHAQSVE
jgi:hypothetical protein